MATQDVELPSRENAAQARAILLKPPKGTHDSFGEPTKLRKQIFQKLSAVFECHGAQELDTPVFELRNILSNQYGEESRLIYDLEDQGGEICSLRYDLTVPFARWLAMNPKVTQVSRYHIAKVYRRDQPATSRGRYREFYQCDFDIAGEYDPMIPDAEVLLVAAEAFEALDIDVTVKLNHRRILNGMFTIAGVPNEKIRTISSAVDKLDKLSWEEVKKEMVEEKGLDESVADEVGRLVRNRGGLREMIEFLKSDPNIMDNDDIRAGVDEMTLLMSYLEAYHIADKISFDLSLARGLDYYTGLIYEVVYVPSSSDRKVLGSDEPWIQVGSIAAGGRYDELVGRYYKCKSDRKPKRNMPCVGISFGVERIFKILEARPVREFDVYEVFVAAAGSKDDGLILERMRLLGQLTKAGLRATFMRKANPKLNQQCEAARRLRVPLMVILDADDLAAGKVRLKVWSFYHGREADAKNPEQERREHDQGRLVSMDNLIVELKRLLQQ